MREALAGVRVLDFGRYVAGPYCATLLGYLGADVIRIERPDGGEDRYMHPLAAGEADAAKEGSLIFHTGCNKRGLALDPAHPDGREVVRRLVARADVVIANLPDTALSRLGLDFESLRSIKPDIVLATQSAFGPVGPDSGKPGFDGVGQAMSGAMFFTGLPGAPVKAAAPYVDYSTAVLSAFGVMAALRERDRTGQGQHVEASLLRTALAVFGAFVSEEAALGIRRAPSGNRVRTSGPSDCLACSDGRLLVHVVGEGLFRRLARLIGADDWLADAGLVGDEARGQAADRLCERLGRWCAQRTVAEAVSALGEAGVPCGPVLSLREAVDNPQVDAAGWLKPVGFPGLGAPTPTMDIPLSFSSGAAGIERRPPTLGEHTEEILGELGYDADGVAALRRAGAI